MTNLHTKLFLEENKISIINTDYEDINYGFIIYGDNEPLYGKKEDTIPKDLCRWHIPNKSFKNFSEVKIKINVKLDHSNLDPYGEEDWGDDEIIERFWKIDI